MPGDFYTFKYNLNLRLEVTTEPMPATGSSPLPDINSLWIFLSCRHFILRKLNITNERQPTHGLIWLCLSFMFVVPKTPDWSILSLPMPKMMSFRACWKSSINWPRVSLVYEPWFALSKYKKKHSKRRRALGRSYTSATAQQAPLIKIPGFLFILILAQI